MGVSFTVKVYLTLIPLPVTEAVTTLSPVSTRVTVPSSPTLQVVTSATVPSSCMVKITFLVSS